MKERLVEVDDPEDVAPIHSQNEEKKACCHCPEKKSCCWQALVVGIPVFILVLVIVGIVGQQVVLPNQAQSMINSVIEMRSMQVKQSGDNSVHAQLEMMVFQDKPPFSAVTRPQKVQMLQTKGENEELIAEQTMPALHFGSGVATGEGDRQSLRVSMTTELKLGNGFKDFNRDMVSHKVLWTIISAHKNITIDVSIGSWTLTIGGLSLHQTVKIIGMDNLSHTSVHKIDMKTDSDNNPILAVDVGINNLSTVSAYLGELRVNSWFENQLVGSMTTFGATLRQGDNVFHFEGPLQASGEVASTIVSNFLSQKETLMRGEMAYTDQSLFRDALTRVSMDLAVPGVSTPLLNKSHMIISDPPGENCPSSMLAHSIVTAEILISYANLDVYPCNSGEIFGEDKLHNRRWCNQYKSIPCAQQTPDDLSKDPIKIKGNSTSWTKNHISRLIMDNIDLCYVDIIDIVKPQGSLVKSIGKMTLHLGSLTIPVKFIQKDIPIFGEQVQ